MSWKKKPGSKPSRKTRGNALAIHDGVAIDPYGKQGPTPEHKQHAAFAKEDQYEGRELRRVSRKIDLMSAMERNGTIERSWAAAGRKFQEDFDRAYGGMVKAADVCRQPDQGGCGVAGNEIAKDEVWRALRALGGLGNPSGEALWHILGEGLDIKDWALRSNFGVSEKTARGVLVGALGQLAVHYWPKRGGSRG